MKETKPMMMRLVSVHVEMEQILHLIAVQVEIVNQVMMILFKLKEKEFLVKSMKVGNILKF